MHLKYLSYSIIVSNAISNLKMKIPSQKYYEKLEKNCKK